MSLVKVLTGSCLAKPADVFRNRDFLQHPARAFGFWGIPRLVRNSLLFWPSADSRIVARLQVTAHESAFASAFACMQVCLCVCVCVSVEPVAVSPVVTCSGCGTSQATPPWRLHCGLGCLVLSIWPQTVRLQRCAAVRACNFG